MLTISKALSAGQAQTYHQKEFTAKEQNYWSQRGVIAGEWQGRLAKTIGLAGAVSAEDFAKLSRASIHKLASSWYDNERPMNIRTPTARPSRRWNTGPVGTRPFLRPNLSRLPRLSAAMNVFAKRTGKASVSPLTSLNATRKRGSAAIIRPRPRASLLPPNSSTIPPARSMATLLRSFIPTP